MPNFFATTGKTTSSQLAPFGGVYVSSGGIKCAATPSRDVVGVLSSLSDLSACGDPWVVIEAERGVEVNLLDIPLDGRRGVRAVAAEAEIVRVRV
jgi:hypothetical protein